MRPATMIITRGSGGRSNSQRPRLQWLLTVCSCRPDHETRYSDSRAADEPTRKDSQRDETDDANQSAAIGVSRILS